MSLAGTSKFEDAWVYDGKRLVDVGFRDPFLWKDTRGNNSLLSNFDDILRVARGKKEISFYHLHPNSPGNQVNLMTVEDISVAIKYFKGLRKDGVQADFYEKVACKDGIYSLKVDESMALLYDGKKGGFEDYVYAQTTKKEFELLGASKYKDKIMNNSGKMDAETVAELRRIQLAALESVGLKVVFTKAE